MKIPIILLLVFFGGCVPAFSQTSFGNMFETKSIAELGARVDFSCMNVKMSPCPTPKPPYVGIWYRYWEPAFLMETVKAPGDYIIREAGVLLSKPLKAISKDKTSTSSSQSLGDASLQFNETHLYDFPLKLFMDAVMCPATLGDGLMVRYLSELNSSRWREGRGEPAIPLMLGQWGPLYPRVGFLVHWSTLVASATTCVRAVNTIGAGPNLVMDKMQMVHPYKSNCMPIGMNMSLFEGLHAKDGRYVWVYWRYRECCRTVSG